MSPILRWLLVVLVAALVAGIDSASKHWARRRLSARSRTRFGLSMHLRENHRAASGSMRWLVLFWVFGTVGALAFCYLAIPDHPFLLSACLGAAIGGSGANLIEILRHRRITDFLDLGLGGVFNVADLGIYLGVLGAVGMTLFDLWRR